MVTIFEWDERLDITGKNKMDDINFVYFVNNTFRMLPETDDEYDRIINILILNEFSINQQAQILYYLSMSFIMTDISDVMMAKLVSITDEWESAWYKTISDNSSNSHVKYFGNDQNLENNLESMRKIIR